MLFSQFHHLSNLIILIKFDWMWDLAVLLIGLVQLDNLVEMRMECLGDSSEFSLAFILLAEGKHFSSGVIVELKELRASKNIGLQGAHVVN